MKVCAECRSPLRIIRIWQPCDEYPDGHREESCDQCGCRETMEKPRKFLVCFDIVGYNRRFSLPGQSFEELEVVTEESIRKMESTLYRDCIKTAPPEAQAIGGQLMIRGMIPLEG